MGHEVNVVAAHDSQSRSVAGTTSTPLSAQTRWIRAIAHRCGWSERAVRLEVERRSGQFDLLIVGHVNLIPSLAPLLRSKSRQWKCCMWAYGRDVWGGAGRRLSQHVDDIDHIVSISQYTAERLRLDAGRQHVMVIPPCVDTDYFVPASERALIRYDEILICGRMASVDGYKGHDVLLRALPLAEKLCGRPLTIRVVGEGGNMPTIQLLAASLGLQDKVVFEGRVSYAELREAYQRCGVFVLPTRVTQRSDSLWSGDGFGIVYLEAAACGRPVLASKHGGAAETIVDATTGYLVDPESPESVAAGVFQTLSSRDHANALGHVGRRHVVEHFSMAAFKRNLAGLVAVVQSEDRYRSLSAS